MLFINEISRNVKKDCIFCNQLYNNIDLNIKEIKNSMEEIEINHLKNTERRSS